MKFLVIPAAIASLFIATEATAQVVSMPKPIPKAQPVPVPKPQVRKLPKIQERVAAKPLTATANTNLVDPKIFIQQVPPETLPMREKLTASPMFMTIKGPLANYEVAGVQMIRPTDCDLRCEILFTHFATRIAQGNWRGRDLTIDAARSSEPLSWVRNDDPNVVLARRVGQSGGGNITVGVQHFADERFQNLDYFVKLVGPDRKRRDIRVSGATFYDPDAKTDADGDGYFSIATGGVDCDDNNAGRNPGMTELPNGGADEDCNPRTFGEVDADNDGFPSDQHFNVTEGGREYRGTDCNDSDIHINPRAGDDQGDGVDNDCDGKIDEHWPQSPIFERPGS